MRKENVDCVEEELLDLLWGLGMIGILFLAQAHSSNLPKNDITFFEKGWKCAEVQETGSSKPMPEQKGLFRCFFWWQLFLMRKKDGVQNLFLVDGYVDCSVLEMEMVK